MLSLITSLSDLIKTAGGTSRYVLAIGFLAAAKTGGSLVCSFGAIEIANHQSHVAHRKGLLGGGAIANDGLHGLTGFLIFELSQRRLGISNALGIVGWGAKLGQVYRLARHGPQLGVCQAQLHIVWIHADSLLNETFGRLVVVRQEEGTIGVFLGFQHQGAGHAFDGGGIAGLILQDQRILFHSIVHLFELESYVGGAAMQVDTIGRQSQA
ncbi:MAG: hypothetical protein BWY75_02425 [bacterium ADurb.Bin425]|nr:MAG: hypothetical protein BWY75_02425 [bacterium ADurb.Bin425]